MEINIQTHKAYASVDSNNIVTKLFSDVFIQPTDTDVLIIEGQGDSVVYIQNSYTLMDENQCYNYKIVDGKIVTRDLEEKQSDVDYINRVKIQKLQEISNACEKTVYAGTDVTTSLGVEHFSCTANDQTNISASASAVLQGATQIPYHADGKLCRVFSGEEITNLYTSVKLFVTYQVTFCNHLNIWIKRCTTIDELNSITYASKLPSDLLENFNTIMGIVE